MVLRLLGPREQVLRPGRRHAASRIPRLPQHVRGGDVVTMRSSGGRVQPGREVLVRKRSRVRHERRRRLRIERRGGRLQAGGGGWRGRGRRRLVGHQQRLVLKTVHVTYVRLSIRAVAARERARVTPSARTAPFVRRMVLLVNAEAVT